MRAGKIDTGGGEREKRSQAVSAVPRFFAHADPRFHHSEGDDLTSCEKFYTIKKYSRERWKPLHDELSDIVRHELVHRCERRDAIITETEDTIVYNAQRGRFTWRIKISYVIIRCSCNTYLMLV